MNESPSIKRRVAGGLVLLTTAGLVVSLTSVPAGAVVSASGDEIGSPVQPNVEPDPDASVFVEGDPSAGVNPADSIEVTSVPPPPEAGQLKAKATSGNNNKGIRINPTLTPGASKRSGVAQVVTMRFPVSINRKAKVERAISVTARRNGKKAKPVSLPKGRWGWVDDRTAVYRPKTFWPGNSTIKFSIDLKDRLIAKHGTSEYVGANGSKMVHKIRTGRKLVLHINNRKHELNVFKNGKRVKTFGVSLGKSSYQTRSGIKVLSDIKYRVLRMVGRDRYTGEKWDVMSPYSMPITTNGEFLHGAPWARHRIGRANGSHGCTNMNSEDAKWLFYRVRKGDPVVTKGTGRSMYSGLAFTEGKPWAYSWKKWKAKSAL